MKFTFRFLLIATLLLGLSNAYSQVPQKQWDATFGGSEGDFLFSAIQTSDGGFILGGYSESGISGDVSQSNRGSSDYWIVKTDANGAKQWDARFGGNSVDQLTVVQKTSDGGYILGGRSFSGISGEKTQSNRGQSDFWIVKTDANGVKQWDATFGGNSYDELHALQQTSDGGFILGGYSMSAVSGDQTNTLKGGRDFWVVKTDANGVKQWDAAYGANKFEEINSLTQTSDGGYLFGGYSESGQGGAKSQPSQGARDYWIVKTNANGKKQWDAAFGGTGDDWLTSLQQTTDGGYILGGWSWSQATGDKTQPTKGDNDYWMVKIDGSGTKQWDADFGGNSNDYLGSILQTTDGGYALAGYSSSAISGDKTQASQGGADYWMVKTDGVGVRQWDVQFGGSDFDFLSTMQQTSDGGYLLGGYSYTTSTISGDKSQAGKGLNDYWVVKTTGSTASCIAPTNLSSLNITANGATLKWDAVNGAVSYKISYKTTTASQWITVNVNTKQKTIQGLQPNTTYVWHVKTICSGQSNTSAWSQNESFTTNPLRLEVTAPSALAVYPNPVSSSATISFSLDQDAPLSIMVADINGRFVSTITNESYAAGNHEITFNRGSLKPGIYFLQLKTGEETITKKLVVE